MQWACANCGSLTSRSRTTFDQHGKQLQEICPHCAPQALDEPMRVPSDEKLYTGPQAYPHLYKQSADGVYRAKDELIADTAALWDKGPHEEAKARKRATRRTEPLTPEEQRKANEWAKNVLEPAIAIARTREAQA
jgi:hypothetical protein